MSATNSNAVVIKLEISVPIGGGAPAVTLSTPTPKVAPVALPAVAVTHCPNGGTAPVLPDVETSLGTICARATYSTPMANVWMAAIPAVLFPEFGTTPPGPDFHRFDWAKAGATVDGGLTWTWAGTGNGAGTAVRWAAHRASPGVVNVLCLWSQAPDAKEEFESPSWFRGVTDPTPCTTCSGSGSGSGSGSESGGSTPNALRLDGLAGVAVRVPDGPFKGDYVAERIARRLWRVTVGGTAYLLTSDTGNDLELSGGAVVDKPTKLSTYPLSAAFPGRRFGSKGDILVLE